jgi:predicted HTH domain antitoxin
MAAVTIELPDVIIKELETPSGAISRCVLEAVALEGYRSQKLSRGEVRQLLGLTWHETEAFLARHGMVYHYTAEDFEEDQKTLDRIVKTS